MKKVSVTRMELLAHKAQISLARQGRELLEQKRTALMKEFLRIADTVVERSDALSTAAEDAWQALARISSPPTRGARWSTPSNWWIETGRDRGRVHARGAYVSLHLAQIRPYLTVRRARPSAL